MLLTDYCENFVLAHYEDFVAFEFDFGACVFAVEHFVAGLENHFFVFGARTVPLRGFSLAESGMMMPELVTSSAAVGLMMTRSARGFSFMTVCCLVC